MVTSMTAVVSGDVDGRAVSSSDPPLHDVASSGGRPARTAAARRIARSGYEREGERPGPGPCHRPSAARPRPAARRPAARRPGPPAPPAGRDRATLVSTPTSLPASGPSAWTTAPTGGRPVARHDHAPQAAGDVAAPGVDAGHQLLAGVAALGEAHREVDDAGLGGDGGLVELAAHHRDPGLDAGHLVGVERAQRARRRAPHGGRRADEVDAGQPGPVGGHAARRHAPRGPRARARPGTATPSRTSMSAFTRSLNRLRRSTTAGAAAGVGVEDVLLVARPRSAAGRPTTLPWGWRSSDHADVADRRRRPAGRAGPGGT